MLTHVAPALKGRYNSSSSSRISMASFLDFPSCSSESVWTARGSLLFGNQAASRAHTIAKLLQSHLLVQHQSQVLFITPVHQMIMKTTFLDFWISTCSPDNKGTAAVSP